MRREWQSWRRAREMARRRRGRQRVIFFSHGRQDWPHLWSIAAALAGDCSAQIVYVCATADDPAIRVTQEGIELLLLDGAFLRTIFLATAEADLCVSTLPDLGLGPWRRSNGIRRYVFVPHSLVSCHAIYRPSAFDAFDEVFCAGSYQIKELRALEAYRELPRKELIEFGYPRLDAICSAAAARSRQSVPCVLIAPSWGAPGLLEGYGARIINDLLAANYRVIVRPHPETMKRSVASMQSLFRQFENRPAVVFDTAIESSNSLVEADLMISDWSGAALEFALGLERPVLFIDIAQKINNPDYASLGIDPVEAWIRPKIGVVLPTSDLGELADHVSTMCGLPPSEMSRKLQALRHELVFNPGTSAVVGAERLRALLDHPRTTAGSW